MTSPKTSYMNKYLVQTIQAIKVVLRDRKYLIGFILVSISTFWLFIYIPVKNIPGNDFAFQLSIMSKQDFLLLAILSLLTSLSVTMNVYPVRNKPSVKAGISLAGQSGTGLLSGIVGFLFGTATCASCVASIFGFLGVGAVFFLLDHRVLIVSLAILLLLISLYFTSRRVLGICDNCKVKQ